MATQDTTLTGLLNLIAELRAREKEQEAALEETRHDIESVQRSLALLRDRYGISAQGIERKIPLESLKEKTHHQALVILATANDYTVKVTEAKRIFLEAGLMTNPKTAYQMITSTLIRSKRFRHVGPGEYRLTVIDPPGWERFKS